MVSVVIVSFNTKEITLKCLESVSRSTGVELEIIVVDNASTDGSKAEIKKRYSKIRIIENKKNKGFGTANNRGMKSATGEYILLLNSDCFVENNTIFELLTSPKDVVGCKLVNQDGSTQQSWGYFPTLRRVAQMMFFIDNLPMVRDVIDSIHVRSVNRYEAVRQVDWVTGAFLLLRRTVYEKTGGFDENFFMYGEEIEWQYRMRQQGYQIWFDPRSSATHLVGASSPTRAPAVIGEIEGWKYWFGKYFPEWQESALRAVVFIGCLLRMVFKPQWARFYREALLRIFWPVQEINHIR